MHFECRIFIMGGISKSLEIQGRSGRKLANPEFCQLNAFKLTFFVKASLIWG